MAKASRDRLEDLTVSFPGRKGATATLFQYDQDADTEFLQMDIEGVGFHTICRSRFAAPGSSWYVMTMKGEPVVRLDGLLIRRIDDALARETPGVRVRAAAR